MAKGKEFERIVAIITQALAREAEVKAPDFLPDLDTGELREVDCSIVSKVGPYSLLIIQEARDRTRPVSVPYVEEVIQKAKSVGAQKAAIVSSKGFTGPAKKKADRNRVDLFTVDEAESQDWRKWSWITFEELIVHEKCKEVQDVRIQLEKGVDTKAIYLKLNEKFHGMRIPFNNKVLYDEKRSSWLSMLDMISGEKGLFEGVKPGAPPIQREIKLEESGEGLYLDVGDMKAPVKTLHIIAKVWIEVKKVPIKHLTYIGEAGKGQRLAEYAEASFESGDRKVSVSLVQDKQKGTTQVFGKVSEA